MIAPQRSDEYRYRYVDCQTAVANDVLHLIEKAEKAGWSAEEAARAISDLAKALSRGLGKELRSNDLRQIV
ncbi:hypothetical protein Brsp06_04807 [Brucella sp. NBRC 13694]|jgi:hypothetical protein|uniref:hypothetical protein n=1 Tax=Brucella sp. NBRC 13694 TaxID=3075482 RepID=UPI0030B1EFCB